MFGNCGNNDTILWFIILFLLLFCCNNGSDCGCGCSRASCCSEA